jgi:hypothetical protein
MTKLKRIFLLTLLILITHLSYSQYAGTYTVGGSSPTFANLDSAFNNLERKGVKGSVRLNVRSGTYLGQTTIGYISGTSNTNIIKVAPDPKNNGPVIFKNKNTSLTVNYILNIKQGFLRFDSLDFRIDSSSYYGKIVDITEHCKNITFNSCTFYGKDTTGSSFAYVIIYDSENYDVSDYKITNCIFYNGASPIEHRGYSFSIKETGFVFSNNKIYNFLYKGIGMSYQGYPIVKGNYFHDNNKDDYAIGIRLDYCDSAFSITDNQIFINGKDGYGIIVIGNKSYANKRSKIVNNFISLYDSSKNGDSRGLIISENYNDLYYNTIVTYNQFVGSSAIAFGGGYCNVKNNNFVHLGKGYACRLGVAPSSTNDIDNNNYFSAGVNLGYSTYALKNLSDIQNFSGMDANSISSKVKFKNPKDFHTTSYMLNGSGTPVSGITTDLDNQTRNSKSPDIGADEFDPLPDDITLVKLDFSKLSECGMDSSEIGAIIKNVGQSKQANFNIYAQISGSISKTLTHNYTDSINPLQQDTIYFKKFNTYKGGTFNFKVFTALTKDGDMSNDTLSSKRYFNTSPDKPESKRDTLCNNVPYFLTTKHELGTVLRWYKSKTDVRPIIENNNLLGSNLQKDTNYYVSSVLYGGVVSSSITTLNAMGSQCAGGVMFDIIPKKKLILDSISSIFNNSGLQTVYIYTKKGSYSGFESTSAKWKFVDSIKINPTSLNSYVKFSLTKSLSFDKDSTYGIYLNYYSRYTTKSASTEYLNQDIKVVSGSGLCSKFGGVNTNVVFNGQLFYHYIPECESERAVYSIKVNKATVNLGKDTAFCANSGIKLKLNAGSGFASYNWSTAETTPTITITKEGTYSVTVTDINKCTGNDNIVITKNANPKVNIGRDTAYCAANGFIYNLNAGTGYKTYNWKPMGTAQAIKDSVTRTHSIIVTNDKNCEAMDTITITVNKNPVVNLGKDTMYCTSKNTSRILDAGSGFANYKWSNSSTAQTLNIYGSGIFSVIVTDTKKCKGGDTISIIENINPTVNLGRDTTFCKGGNKKLDAGKGFTYHWSNGAKTQTILADSTDQYSVEIIDFYKCSAKDTVKITVNKNPLVKLGADKIVNPDLPINETLDAGSGFKTYDWNTSEKTQKITVNTDGIYFVKVSNDKGCIGSDTIVVRYWAPGIINTLEYSKIRVYPSPSSQAITIFSESSVIEKIEIYEMNGKLLFTKYENAQTSIVDTNKLANGIYLMTLYYGGTMIKTKILVKH